MRPKHLAALAVLSFGLCLIVKVLQVSLTPEARAWLEAFVSAVLQSSGVRFLIVLTAFAFLGSLVAAGFESNQRRYERRQNERNSL